MMNICFALFVSVTLLCPVALLTEDSTSSRRGLVQPGHCLDVSEELVGHKAVQIGGDIKQPKKIRDAEPHYPTRETPTVGTGVWLGEVLIGADGKVRGVWPLREPSFESPWPEFNDAIVDTIKKWEYSPTKVDGRAVPVCMMMSLHIQWK